MPTIIYKQTDDFEKDFKRLLKKFPTLNEDIEEAKVFAINLFHLQNMGRKAIFPIPDFCSKEVKIYKLKKFACKSFKGRGVRSGIRIIYAFYEEFLQVDFIEIYFKGNKENEDFERIKNYLKNMIKNDVRYK